MSWSSALAKPKPAPAVVQAAISLANVDLKSVVTIDFETYWDKDYTLRKLSTSEYIRDPRFKAHVAGIKLGTGAVKVYSGEKLALFLKNVDWSRHDILCHNAAFDGFILSHHYGVLPRHYYDTLCMARGLHSNDIRANLDAVSQFYGVGNKIPNVLETSQGVLNLDKEQFKAMSAYCAEDVRLTFEIFKQMLITYPAKELELIDLTIRMFCEPLLHVDIARVEVELARELKEKETKLLSMIGDADMQARVVKNEKGLDGALEFARKLVAKNESFADILRDSGVNPPMKQSPSNPLNAIYAFSKTDSDFIELLSHPDIRVRTAVECRLSVKSTTNETRAERRADQLGVLPGVAQVLSIEGDPPWPDGREALEDHVQDLMRRDRAVARWRSASTMLPGRGIRSPKSEGLARSASPSLASNVARPRVPSSGFSSLT